MALREITALFKTRADLRGVNSFNQSLGRARASFKGLAATLGVGLTVRAISNTISDIITLGDSMQRGAEQTGLSVARFQELQFAAGRARITATDFRQTMQRVARSMFEASEGNRVYTRTYRDLGIEIEDSEGNLRSMDEIVPELAQSISELGSATEQAGVLQRLAGRSGAQLIPLFKRGAEGIAESVRRFREITGAVDFEGFAKRSDEAKTAMVDFEVAMTAIKVGATNELIPALTDVITRVTAFVGSILRSEESMSRVKTVLGALSTVLLAFAARALLANISIIPLIVAAGALFLVLDDLQVAMRGGDSVFRDFLETVMGAKAAQEFIGEFTETINAFSAAINSIGSDDNLFLGFLRETASQFTGGGGEGARQLDPFTRTSDPSEAFNFGGAKPTSIGGSASELATSRLQAARELPGRFTFRPSEQRPGTQFGPVGLFPSVANTVPAGGREVTNNLGGITNNITVNADGDAQDIADRTGEAAGDASLRSAERALQQGAQ